MSFFIILAKSSIIRIPVQPDAASRPVSICNTQKLGYTNPVFLLSCRSDCFPPPGHLIAAGSAIIPTAAGIISAAAATTLAVAGIFPEINEKQPALAPVSYKVSRYPGPWLLFSGPWLLFSRRLLHH